MKHYDIQVPGAKASGKLTVTSPFDGSPVATVDTIDAGGADIALQNAADTFADHSCWLDAAQRIAILEKTAALMAERFEHLVAVAVAEGGKPLADTRVEVTRAIDGVKNCIECLRSEHGTEIPMRLNPASMGRTAYTRLQPIGPVMAVSAFNHPLNLIVHQVGPAVASGCPVIVKPAEDTPASCFEFVAILREAGLPEEWCQPVTVNDLAVAEQLVTDPRIAFFGFIGSALVGWHLKSKLAPGVRCALEHGGI
ncbi:MAG: aldehyde dehydrogenase, partial [Gammaproteobacteria bacterium]